MHKRGEKSVSQEIIYGRHSVQMCLEKDMTSVEKLWIQSGTKIPATLKKLIDEVRKTGAVVQVVQRQPLDRITDGGAHQGIAVRTAAVSFTSLQDWLNAQTGKEILVLILDGVQDPGNMGAIFRSASAAGVNGIILPKKGSAPLGATAMKRSAGTLNQVPAIRVTNVRNTIQYLQKRGFFVFGLSEKAEDTIVDMGRPDRTAILVGSEDRGVRAINATQSDGMRSIPLIGAAGSLNVSAAVAIVLYELTRHRWSGSTKTRNIS